LSLQIEKQRQKRKQKGKFKIRVRYKHAIYRTIETDDYGSFKEMYAKYKDKYEFWCGDVPPEKIENGCYQGVRLDSDVFDRHAEYSLERFGKHKCWIDETYKINGKKVCLVYNAQFDVGTFGTVTGAAVGINTVARLNKEAARRRRAKARKKKARWHTNHKTRRRYKR
jgi:hypothetical protein